jgi:pimeloyl-ACP methyl ester carboxylesterase
LLTDRVSIHRLTLNGKGLAIDGEPLHLAADLYVPNLPTADAKLLVCLPGGSVNRHYYDLGDGEDRCFSFARALCAAGHFVVAIDPPGVGESGRIKDGYRLTVEAQLPLLNAAVAEIRSLAIDGFNLSALPVVGVGHSAGAMLTAALQARFRPYCAVALLCFGTGGLPQYLRPEYLAALNDPVEARANIADHARAMFPQAYSWNPERPASGPAARALRAVLAPKIAPVALQAMTPGNIAPELAVIDVPVFTAVGERDMLGPPHLLPSAYVACTDFSQIIVEGAGHHIFVVPAAKALFGRIAAWLDAAPSMRGERNSP